MEAMRRVIFRIKLVNIKSSIDERKSLAVYIAAENVSFMPSAINIARPISALPRTSNSRRAS